MPDWGEGAYRIHSFFFHVRVMFFGSLHVLPSSVLVAIRNWALLPISQPFSDPPSFHW